MRQLNFYCFKKVSKERSSFTYLHENFQHNRPELLALLQRKKAVTPYGQQTHTHASAQSCAQAHAHSHIPSTGERDAQSRAPVSQGSSLAVSSSSSSSSSRAVDKSLSLSPRALAYQQALSNLISATAALPPRARAAYSTRDVNTCECETDDEDDEIFEPAAQFELGCRALCQTRHPSMLELFKHQPLSSDPSTAGLAQSRREHATHNWDAATRFFSPRVPPALLRATQALSSKCLEQSKSPHKQTRRLLALQKIDALRHVLPAVEAVLEFCMGRNPFEASAELYSEVAQLLQTDLSMALEVSGYMQALIPDQSNSCDFALRLSRHVGAAGGGSTDCANTSSSRPGSDCGGSETDTASSTRSHGSGGPGDKCDNSISGESEEEESVHPSDNASPSPQSSGHLREDRRHVSVILGGGNLCAASAAGRKRVRDGDGGDYSDGAESGFRPLTSSSSSAGRKSPSQAALSSNEVVLMRTFMSYAIASIQTVVDALYERPGEDEEGEGGQELARELTNCCECWREYAKMHM